MTLEESKRIRLHCELDTPENNKFKFSDDIEKINIPEYFKNSKDIAFLFTVIASQNFDNDIPSHCN